MSLCFTENFQHFITEKRRELIFSRVSKYTVRDAAMILLTFRILYSNEQHPQFNYGTFAENNATKNHEFLLSGGDDSLSTIRLVWTENDFGIEVHWTWFQTVKVYLVLRTESARYEWSVVHRPKLVKDDFNITIPNSFMIPSNNSYNFTYSFNSECSSTKQTIIVKSARSNKKERETMRTQFASLQIQVDIYFMVGEVTFDSKL